MMINYSISAINKEGHPVFVQSGYVSNVGKVDLDLVKEVPVGGSLVLEWELDGNDGNTKFISD